MGLSWLTAAPGQKTPDSFVEGEACGLIGKKPLSRSSQACGCVRLGCVLQLTGEPEPEVRWLVSGVELAESDKYHIERHETTLSLTIYEVTVDDTEMTYSCKVPSVSTSYCSNRLRECDNPRVTGDFDNSSLSEDFHQEQQWSSVWSGPHQTRIAARFAVRIFCALSKPKFVSKMLDHKCTVLLVHCGHNIGIYQPETPWLCTQHSVHGLTLHSCSCVFRRGILVEKSCHRPTSFCKVGGALSSTSYLLRMSYT